MDRLKAAAYARRSAELNAPYDAALAKRQIARAEKLEAQSDAEYEAERAESRDASLNRLVDDLMKKEVLV